MRAKLLLIACVGAATLAFGGMAMANVVVNITDAGALDGPGGVVVTGGPSPTYLPGYPTAESVEFTLSVPLPRALGDQVWLGNTDSYPYDIAWGIWYDDAQNTQISDIWRIQQLSWNQVTKTAVFDIGFWSDPSLPDTSTWGTPIPWTEVPGQQYNLRTMQGGSTVYFQVLGSRAEEVPEPSTLVLLGIGAISLLAWRKRTRKA